MSAVQYVGRTTKYYGSTLWEIVSNLRNFGVGRIIIRKTFQRYPEPCYYRIMQVRAVDDPQDVLELRKVHVTVEKTWRGVTNPKPIVLFSSTYKPDYELVRMAEEHKYLNNSKRVIEKVIPTKIELPPLLREYVTNETGDKNPQMNVNFKKTNNRFVRFAKENEKPTIDFSLALGKPSSARLYKGVL